MTAVGTPVTRVDGAGEGHRCRALLGRDACPG